MSSQSEEVSSCESGNYIRFDLLLGSRNPPVIFGQIEHLTDVLIDNHAWGDHIGVWATT